MTLVADRLNAVLRRVPSWPLYLGGCLPAIWWFWQALNGAMGPEPVKALEHIYGETALQLLLVTLTVTPLRHLAGINLLKYRRAFGLLSFLYVVLHFSVYLALDQQFDWAEIWKDIVKRPYITIGMAAFVVLVPLAVTSNMASIRRLGALKWNRLHRLSYLAVIAGAVHYLLLVKAWPIEPIPYCMAAAILVGFRYVRRKKTEPASKNTSDSNKIHS